MFERCNFEGKKERNDFSFNLTLPAKVDLCNGCGRSPDLNQIDSYSCATVSDLHRVPYNSHSMWDTAIQKKNIVKIKPFGRNKKTIK